MFKFSMLVLVFISFFLTSIAIAGPYGLEMGMSLKDIGADAKRIGLGKYVISKVPKPDLKFEDYVIKVSQNGGLYWIKAVGKTISTTPDGSAIRKAFEKVKHETEAIYGNYKIYDFFVDGSAWEQPDDWMQGVIEWERVLGALWRAGEGEIMPDNLLEVFVGVEAISPNEGFVSIEYTFSNIDSCEKELAGIETWAF